MVLLDVVLMALISVAIVGLLVWSICTQHRHHGCEDIRVGRPRIDRRRATPDQTEVADSRSTLTAI